MDERLRREMGLKLREVRTRLNKTQKEFYGPISPFVNNFSAIENGNRVIGNRLAKDIMEVYNLNENWLSGKSSLMFNLEGGQTPELRSNAPLRDNPTGVPFFDSTSGELQKDISHILREAPAYYVDFKPFNDCDAYLPVLGDSMLPKFTPGDVIAVKRCVNLDVILWGETYLVETDAQANNLFALRIVRPGADANAIVLQALNPEFSGELVIPKNAIRNLYLVKGKITRSQF